MCGSYLNSPRYRESSIEISVSTIYRFVHGRSTNTKHCELQGMAIDGMDTDNDNLSSRQEQNRTQPFVARKIFAVADTKHNFRHDFQVHSPRTCQDHTQGT
ncbi:hypothetical protein AcW1_000173 [Taiwanofungus camphoratus]|nr:hypothetical protein AcV5_004070 [Antrodia cinnamomea]KAI0962955.1 hypothetical protein AcW1_000173 [Antrodia cinnamomea]